MQSPGNKIAVIREAAEGKEMTTEQRFREMKYAAERSLRGDKLQCYLSGHKNTKTRLEKMVKRYKEDSEIDYELGVISKETYDYEIAIHDLMVENLKNFNIY